MSERLAFIKACLDRTERIVEICDRFGISEKTGQKWLKRFRERDLLGLEDQSRARLTHPHRITPEVAGRIIALRRKYPLYGPAMLRDWLRLHEPGEHWPAASSIGELLKRANLIRSKRRRHQSAERAALDGSRTRALEPNMVWTADFKGQFRLRKGKGVYCYPLTVLDLHTHYLLGCTALETTSVAPARKVFVRLFREYGLPMVLRTDNGVPFAQPNALGRLGSLAFWWVRLGIRPEHITLARPSENGAHERFHKTLKAAATRPASESFPAQQRRFDHFKTEYNTERPHQSLAEHSPPGHLYTPSPRPYPTRLPALVYPDSCFVRLVDRGGNIKWRNQALFLSSNLAGDYVSLREGEDDTFTIAYGSLELGDFDSNTNRFTPRVRWSG
ncbi:MAG: helix-turn-helix domain-containing protein [Gemmatimonadota bacterium]|nr:helix-turn-helix domain-containing protein [Gemmatimonadota bacterium]